VRTTSTSCLFTVVGESTSRTVNGVTIIIQWVRPEVFTVTVRPAAIGGAEIDRCSYSTYDEAAAEANRARGLYRAQTPAEVKTRREELAGLIELWDGRRSPTAAHNVRRYERELTALAALRPAGAAEAVAYVRESLNLAAAA
jgi:hypothetical protein